MRFRPWFERWPMAKEVDQLRKNFAAAYGTWHGEAVGRALVFRGEVDVPTLPKRRRVAICFPGPPSRVRPHIMVSGPERSRHRFKHYRPTALCLYYYRDPVQKKWRLEDGLVGLIDLIRQHLFWEEWYRTYGRWPWDEVHLDSPVKPGTTPTSMRPRARRERARRECWCGRGRYAGCHGGMDADAELRVLGIDTDPIGDNRKPTSGPAPSRR